MLSRKQQEKYNKMREERHYPKAVVKETDLNRYSINKLDFSLVYSSSDTAFDTEAIAERYMDVFDVYDWIVGDWSYGQLRLRGFFDDDRRGIPQERKIKHLTDYLLEYCAFGCDYFVLHREWTPEEKTDQGQEIKKRKQSLSRSSNRKNKHHYKKKSDRKQQNSRIKKSSYSSGRKKKSGSKKRSFTVSGKKSSHSGKQSGSQKKLAADKKSKKANFNIRKSKEKS